MASLNRVCLIGIVATPPIQRTGVARFQLAIPEPRARGTRLQRLEVTLHDQLAALAGNVHCAQAVYVEGRLCPSPDGRPRVEAVALFAVGHPPPTPDHTTVAVTTHASPRPHSRTGHPRRIHFGTPLERVVWVRPTHVGRGINRC